MSDLEDRIVKLEELVAHQAKVLEELSEQVARNWHDQTSYQRRHDALVQRFLSLEENSLPAPEITKPPHY